MGSLFYSRTYRQPHYVFSSRGRSRVYFNAAAICGNMTSFINRTVCRAPCVCSASFGEEDKGVVVVVVGL